MRLLVVEDEKKLAVSLKRGLEADGFAVDIALDGTDGKLQPCCELLSP